MKERTQLDLKLRQLLWLLGLKFELSRQSKLLYDLQDCFKTCMGVYGLGWSEEKIYLGFSLFHREYLF